MSRKKSKRAATRRPTLKTRKPIDELTAADLAAFPIWEFADDEEARKIRMKRGCALSMRR